MIKYVDYIIAIFSLILGVILIFDIKEINIEAINKGFGCIFILFSNLFLGRKR